MQAHPAYTTFARRLVPHYGWVYQYDGSPRIDLAPAILPEIQMRRLHHAAARIAAVYDELCALADKDPSIYDYFELSDWQRRMLDVGGPRWRGIARADVFITTDDRVQICEVNSDTPGGIPDAQLFNAAIRDQHPGLWDLNAGLTRAFARCIERIAGVPKTAALVFPADANEDSAIISLYHEVLLGMGAKVLLGGPANLHPCGDGVGMFGQQFDVMFRHYKSDEMVSQRNPWLFDADIAPPSPPPPTLPSKRPTYQRQLKLVMNAIADKKLRVVNPFGTLLTQNKLALSFMWDHKDRFSRAAALAITELIPETRKLSEIGRERLIAEQKDWVIKSYYGFEGNEAICGAFSKPERWRVLVECLDPAVWVAQRFFEVRPEASGLLPNYGVFLIDGEPMGCLYRISKFETNTTATSAPVLVQLTHGAREARVPAITNTPHVEQRYEHFGDELAIPATALPLASDPGEEAFRWSGHTPDISEAWRVMDTWMPNGNRWEGLMHRNCVLQLLDKTLAKPEPLFTEAMQRAYERGVTVRRELEEREGGGRDVLVWVDLPGEEAIACAMGLAARYLPVIRIDGFAHPRGSVRMDATLGAMLHYENERRALSYDADAPAAIVHDSRRLIDARTDPERVANSYLALIPPIRTLMANGVTRIRAVYEGAEDNTYAGPFDLVLEGFDPRFAREFYDAIVAG